MSITTKIGDKGFTLLLFGSRCRKDSLRMECCGALDELCSFLGLAKSLAKSEKIKAVIEDIQKDIFVIGAEIAAEKPLLRRLKQKIEKAHIKRMEALIAELESKRALKNRHFVLPGQNTVSAALDVARTMARMAERRTAALRNKKILKNTNVMIYLNRLSDLLFLAARACEGGRGAVYGKR